MSAGRLRAAARHAARYLHAETNAAVVSRNAVPMDVGRIASDVGSTSQVSIGIHCLPNAPITGQQLNGYLVHSVDFVLLYCFESG